jgi:hypothetical protein
VAGRPLERQIALGKVTMYGTVKDSDVRLATEPHAGQTTVTLETAATGWRVGDKLVFPDSKQWAVETYAYSPSYEDATIAGISADRKTITLAAPLQFDHPGARNGDDVLEFLPHVADRTRNVTVKSESASGTRGYPSGKTRLCSPAPRPAAGHYRVTAAVP